MRKRDLHGETDTYGNWRTNEPKRTARPFTAGCRPQGACVVMGRLTTHVLDTALGRPAAGLTVELVRFWDVEDRISSGETNSDGRFDRPLLEGEQFRVGVYELRFHAGAYLRRTVALPDPSFLDIIPIRFGIAEPDGHYHVPLLLSPYGYSTYRGS